MSENEASGSKKPQMTMSKKDFKKAVKSAASVGKLKAERDALKIRLSRAEMAAEERQEAAAPPPPPAAAVPPPPAISPEVLTYRELRASKDPNDQARAQIMAASLTREQLEESVRLGKAALPAGLGK